MICKADGLVLVHCWHGSDRAGAVCAAYCIVFKNWTVEAALDEMLYEPFGAHRHIYPNIPEFIRKIDWIKMRRKIKVQGEKTDSVEKQNSRFPGESAKTGVQIDGMSQFYAA